MLRGLAGLHGIREMTYGIVRCSGCGRERIADMSTKRSTCPFCSRSVETSLLDPIHVDDNQSLLRAIMASMSGFEMEEPEKGEDPAPLSTLHYRYKKCGGSVHCLSMLAEGLTELLGEFALPDIEQADPGRGERVLKAMLHHGLAMESSPGKYKAI